MDLCRQCETSCGACTSPRRSAHSSTRLGAPASSSVNRGLSFQVASNMGLRSLLLDYIRYDAYYVVKEAAQFLDKDNTVAMAFLALTQG